MARITEHIDVPSDPRQSFDFIADFTTTPQWDASIVSSVRLDEGPIGQGSRFRVELSLGSRTVPLEYVITTYEPPEAGSVGRVVLTTRGWLHRGADDVRIHPAGTGSRIEWRARFALRGPGLLLDPLLAIGFRKTASQAVAGLESSLVALAADEGN